MVGREDVIGLDISGGYIVAARIRPGKSGRSRVTNAGWGECPAEAGEKETADAIRSLWHKCRFPTYTVCSCLRSRSLNLKFFSYPGITDHELKQALLLEAEQSLQIPQNEIVADWHLNRRDSVSAGDRAEDTITGMLVAVPRSDVDRHVAVLRRARLLPVMVDVACSALANLVLDTRRPGGDEKVNGVMHLGRDTADIAILSEDADLHARTFSLTGMAGGEAAVGRLARQVADELRYYTYRAKRPSVERLLLTGSKLLDGHDAGEPGDDAPLAGVETETLVKEIGAATRVPVVVWDPLQDMSVKDRHLARSIARNEGIGPMMAVALGLALRGS